MSIKGFKGFNKDLQCRGFQYEIGKEYETKKKPVRCTESGFHFCEHPLDIFNYYPPSDSRYCEVEGDGQVDKGDGDTKVAVSKIRIGVEIGIKGIVDAAVKFVFEKADWSKKETQATGYQGAASATGQDTIACGLGIGAKAMASLGNWIVLSEWEQDTDYKWHRKDVKSALVDGEVIKADTYYLLKNGEFVVEEA